MQCLAKVSVSNDEGVFKQEKKEGGGGNQMMKGVWLQAKKTKRKKYDGKASGNDVRTGKKRGRIEKGRLVKRVDRSTRRQSSP
jgi:hypothetical protein